jgi:transposase
LTAEALVLGLQVGEALLKGLAVGTPDRFHAGIIRSGRMCSCDDGERRSVQFDPKALIKYRKSRLSNGSFPRSQAAGAVVDRRASARVMPLEYRPRARNRNRYARRVQEIEHRLDDWLDGMPRTLSPELNRLDNHIRAHRGEWLVFLHDAEVPPTNNHAEQMLRPAVINRKVGGCNKTLWGTLVHGILASIMVTCKRRGKRFLDLARQLWQSQQPQALSLEALPESS